MKKIMLFLLLFLCVLFVGCYNENVDKPEVQKPLVAVAIVPQEAFVKAVAGDCVEVITMIPPGKSPENYAPTPQEIEKFSRAFLYLSIGVPTEEVNIITKSTEFNKTIKVVRLDDEVEKIYPKREFSPGNRDPHIWLSPKRIKVMIEIITKELSESDPQNKSFYENNAKEYKRKLDELDKQIKQSLSNLSNRTFIVYHPAFGYFADDYALNMISLEEEGKDTTAKDLQQKIEAAKKQGIKVIFYQSEIDSKQAKAFAEELGGVTEQVSPLAADYLENMRKTAEVFAGVLK